MKTQKSIANIDMITMQIGVAHKYSDALSYVGIYMILSWWTAILILSSLIGNIY